MSSKSFISSAVLHGVILTLMAMDFSFARFDHTPPPVQMIMVDLSKVKISDKTNLPPKQVKQKPKATAAPKPAPKPETVRPTRQEPIVSAPPPKPKPQIPTPNAAPVIEPPAPKPTPKKQKETPKSAKPIQPKSKSPAKPDLKTLLASVEKVRRSAPVRTPEDPPDEMHLNDGIDGGTGGSLSQVLSISERDLIASQLTACWNLDAGKAGIEDMVIEIRAKISKDGSVREVKIVSHIRNRVMQSVAESAKRAVWICDKKGPESPFRILAEKYADHYSDWKDISLRFNPLTGVM